MIGKGIKRWGKAIGLFVDGYFVVVINKIFKMKVIFFIMKEDNYSEILITLFKKVNDRDTKLDDKLLSEVKNNLLKINLDVKEDKNLRELLTFIEATKKFDDLLERDKFRMSILNGLQKLYDKISRTINN
jgi:hypothetical protein